MPNTGKNVTTNNLKLNAQWLKNAARTLGMNGISTIADISPNMAGVGRAAASSITTVSSAASSVRRQQHPIQYLLESNKYVKLGKRAIDNALSDLAHGKFSNQDRSSGSDMGDTSTGTYFGDMSDGSSDTESNTGQTVQNIYNIDNKAIDNVSNAVNTQTKYQLQMGKANIDTMVAIASSSMTQQQKNSDAILTQVSEMNRGIQALVAYNNESMTKFISASMAYYDAAGKALGAGQSSTSVPTSRSVINENGGLNVDAYKDRAKKQLVDSLKGSTAGFVLQMLADSAEDLANNPLEFASKAIMDKAIPEVTKKALKATDKVFGSFMTEMLLQMGDKWEADTSDGFLGMAKRFAAKAFGINDKRATKINRSGKITTEAAVFDGATRTAIIDELPKYARESTSYLRAIVELMGGDSNAALRGSRILNRETGRYQSMESFAEDFTSSIDSQVIAAMDKSSFGKEMRNMALQMGKNDKQVEMLNKAIDKFFIAAERNEKGAIDIKNIGEGSDMSELIKSANLDPNMQKFIEKTIAGMMRNRTGMESFNEGRQRARRSRNLRVDEISADTGLLRTSNLFRSGNAESEIDIAQLTAESLLPQRRGSGGIKLPGMRSQGIGAAMADALYGNSSARLIGGASPRNMAPGSVGEKLKSIESILLRGVNVRIDPNPPWKGAEGITGGFSKGYRGARGPKPDTTDTPKPSETATPSSAEVDLSDIDRVADEAMGSSNAPATGKGSKIANSLGHAKQAMYLMMTGNASLAMNEMSVMLGETMSGVAGAAKKHILDPLRDAILPTKEVKDENGNVRTEKVTVLEMVKDKFSSMTNMVKESLLGKDENGNVRTLSSFFKEGMTEWRKTIFGDKDPEDIKKEIQSRVPDAVGGAVGGGLIGTLVGGPLFGALVGGAAGFAKKSKWFQDMIFGEEADENGNVIKRGLIPPSVKKYYDENKEDLTKGALTGGLLGMVVGGPLLGAAAGVGVSILKKSTKFNELLFGKEETDEKTGESKKVGGVLNLFREVTGHYAKGTSSDMKGLSAKAAVGVGGGLLLSLFTPLGPIGGAAVGLAASIASNGDKFRQFLFGKKDKDGNVEEAGLFQKMGNNITANVINPLRDGVLDFFDKSKDKVIDKMLTPMLAALQPLLNFGGRLYEKTLGKIAHGVQAAAAGFGNMLKTVGKGIWDRTLGRAGRFAKRVAGMGVSAITGTVGGGFKALGALAERSNRKASLKRFNKENHPELIKQWTEKYNSDPALQTVSLEEYLDDMKSRHYYNYGDKLQNVFGSKEDRETARAETAKRIANRKELRKQALLINELTGGKFSDTGATAKQAALDAYMQSSRYARGKGMRIKHYGKMSQEDIIKALSVDKSENSAISSAQAFVMDEQLEAQKEAAGTLGKIYDWLSDIGRKITGADDPERQAKREERRAARTAKSTAKSQRKEAARKEAERRKTDYENALNETASSTASTWGAKRDEKINSIADKWKDAEKEILKGLKSNNPTVRKAAKEAYSAFFDENGDRIIGSDLREVIPIETAKKSAWKIFDETAHSRKANATQAGFFGSGLIGKIPGMRLLDRGLGKIGATRAYAQTKRAFSDIINGMPHKATGGNVEEGYALVGERGPEVVKFPDKARVLSGKSKIDVNIIGINKQAATAISAASGGSDFSGDGSAKDISATNMFKDFFQKSSEDNERDAFSTSAMSAASTLVATGGVNEKEADEYRKLVDETSKPDSNKGKIKAKLSKILGHSQEKVEDDGKKSFFSKVIDAVKGGFSSLMGNLGIGGVIAAVAGLGVIGSDVKSLWDKVISPDGTMSLGEWLGEESMIGQAWQAASKAIPVIVDTIPEMWNGVQQVSAALGSAAGKFNEFVAPIAEKVVNLIPGVNLTLPRDMSTVVDGPLGGIANMAVAGLYAKAIGAAGSVASAAISAGSALTNLFSGSGNGGGGEFNPMNLVYKASTAAGLVGLTDLALYAGSKEYRNASDARATEAKGGTSERNEVTGEQDNIISAEQHAENKADLIGSSARNTGTTLGRDILRSHGATLGVNILSGTAGNLLSGASGVANLPGRFVTSVMAKSAGEATFREAWRATANTAMNPVSGGLQRLANGANTVEGLTNNLFHAPKGAGEGLKETAKSGLKQLLSKEGAKELGKKMFNKDALKSGAAGIAGGIAGTAGASFGWEMTETAKNANIVGDYGLGNAGGYVRTSETAKSAVTTIMGVAGSMAAAAAVNIWHPGGWIVAIIAGIAVIAAAFAWVANLVVGWIGDAKDRAYSIRSNVSKMKKVIKEGITYVDGADNPMYAYCPQESDRVCGLTKGKFIKDPELTFGRYLRAIADGIEAAPGAEVLLYDLINNMAVQGVPFACELAGSSNECDAKGAHANKESLGDCPAIEGKKTYVSRRTVQKNIERIYQDMQDNIGRQDDTAVFGQEDVAAVYEAGKEVVKALTRCGILSEKGSVNQKMFKNAPGSKKEAGGWDALEKLARDKGTYFITKCLVYINSKIECNKEGKQWIELKKDYIDEMMSNLSDVTEKETEERIDQMKAEGKSQEEIDEALAGSIGAQASESSGASAMVEQIYGSVQNASIRTKDKADVSNELRYLSAAYIYSHPRKLQNWADSVGTASGISTDNLGNDNLINWKKVSDKKRKGMLLDEMAAASLKFAETHGDIFGILPNFDWSEGGKIYTGKSKDPGEKYGSAFVIRGETTAAKSPLGSLYESGKVGSETNPEDIHAKLFGKKEDQKGAEATNVKGAGGKDSIFGKIAQKIVKYGSSEGMEKANHSGSGKAWQKVLYWLPTAYPAHYTDEDTLEAFTINEKASHGGGGRRHDGGRGGKGNVIPFYSQKDPRWAGNAYDTGNTETMADAGCGPTALSMAVDGAGGMGVDPMDAASRLKSLGARNNTGTSWSGMNRGISSYGLNSSQVSNPGSDFIDAGINSGKPVILSGASDDMDDPFTSQGHYVVVSGRDRNGNYIVNDPNQFNPVTYSKEQLTRNAAKGWRVGGGRGRFKVIQGGGRASDISQMMMLDGGSSSSGAADKVVSERQRWINTVRAVKKAIAELKPGYASGDKLGYNITITVGGKTIPARSDCTGMISAALTIFGAFPSRTAFSAASYANTSGDCANKLMAAGFKPRPWGGWDVLQEGDIMAKNGHAEVFCRNEGKKHLVYNCGSTDSVNNPGPTGAAKDSYTTVWRLEAVGTTSGGVNNFDVTTGSTSFTYGGTSTGTDGSDGGLLSKLSSWATSLGSRAVGFMTGSMSLSEATDWSNWRNGTTSSGYTSAGGVDYSNTKVANLTGTTTTEKIWNHLRKDVGFDKYAAAATMGCWHAESNNNPDRFEGDYTKGAKNYGGADAVLASTASLNDYTQNVLFPAYGSKKINRDAYRAEDGNYYPGFGLAQWTGPRGKALVDYAKQHGISWRTLEAQLGYFDYELANNKRGNVNTYNGYNDLDGATWNFMKKYEGIHSPDHFNARIPAARAYYGMYANSETSSTTALGSGTVARTGVTGMANNVQLTAAMGGRGGRGGRGVAAAPVNGSTNARGAAVRGSSAPVNISEHTTFKSYQQPSSGFDPAAIRLLEEIVRLLDSSDGKLNNLKYLSKIESLSSGGGTTNHITAINSANSTTSNRNLRNSEVEKMTSEAYNDARRIIAG